MERKLESAYWMGDPSRGAALGRSSSGKPEGKVYLRKIRLDSGGYDNGGAYWGIGQPLYHAFSDNGFEEFFRANNRESAKDHLKTKFDGISFRR